MKNLRNQIKMHPVRVPLFALAIMLGLAAAPAAFAQNGSDTWVGNASANWGDANWTGANNPPIAGDALFFGPAGTAGAALNNNIAVDTSFAGLTFNANASAFTLGGNEILTTAGIADNSAASTEVVNLPVVLSLASHSANVVGGGNLVLGGVISDGGGGFGLTKTGNGTLTLTNNSTYTGATTVNGGQLTLDYTGGAASIVSSSSILTLGGGTLTTVSASSSTSQTFAGTTIASGVTVISNSVSGTGTPTIALGALTYDVGAAVMFVGPATSTGVSSSTGQTGATNNSDPVTGFQAATANFTTTSGTANQELTGASSGVTDGSTLASVAAFATVGLYDYAIVVNTSPYTVIGASQGTAQTGTAGVGTDGTDGAYTLINAGSLGGGSGSGGGPFDLVGNCGVHNTDSDTALRFNAPGAATLTGGNTLSTAGILVTPNVGAANITETGNIGIGIRSSAAGSLVFWQNNILGELIWTGPTIDGKTVGGGVVKAGSGTAIFRGVNTYTGPTFLDGGVTEINADSGLGAVGTGAVLTLNGGTLLGNAIFTLDNGGVNMRPVVLGNNGGGLAATAGNTMTVDGVISNAVSGTGPLTIGIPASGANGNVAGLVPGTGSGTANAATNATGTVILNAANTYTGGTILQSGALNINGINALGGASYGGLTFNGGTLQYLPGFSGNGSGDLTSIGTAGVTVAAGGGTIDVNGNNVTYAGSIGNGGSGALRVNSTVLGGVLNLGGANTYAGGTMINGGTVFANNTAGSATGSGNVTVASGATLGGTGTISGNVDWQAGSFDSFTVGSPLTVGAVTLNGNPVTVNVPGGTPLGAGVYTLMNYTAAGSSGAFDTGAPTYTGAGVSLATISTVSTGGGVVTLTVIASGLSASWTNDVDGNWSDVTEWSSNPNFPHSAGDAATLGVGSALRTITLDANETVGGIEMTNANSFVIADGGHTLTLDNKGSGASINVNAGTANAINGAVALNDNGIATVGGGKSLAINGAIANASSAETLTVDGAGTTVLAGANSYGPAPGSTGTTLSGGGTLQVGNSSALGAGDLSIVSANGGVLQAGAAGLALPNNISIGSAVTVDNNGNNLTLNGGISGSLLTKTGNGTLTLNGNNTYNGNTTVNKGVLSISSAANVQNTPAIILNGGDLLGSATFALNNNIGIGPALGTAGTNGLVDAASGQTLTVNGVIASSGNSGTNSLTINSIATTPGMVVLAGANTFRGTTTIANGVLQLANPGALQNSTLNYSSGTLDFGSQTAATLGGLGGSKSLGLTNDVAGPVALTVGGNNGGTIYSGSLSDNGSGASLTKAGTGRLTLSGANTYAGSTTGNAGTLEISGGSLNCSNLVGSGFLVDGGTVTLTANTTLANLNTDYLQTGGSLTALGFNGEVNSDGALIEIMGGYFSATSVDMQRTVSYTTAPTATAPIAAATTSGFYVDSTNTVSPAVVNLGSVAFGDANSSGSMRIDGNATVTVTNELEVGAISAGSTRWSILQVNGGSLTDLDTVNGIVLSQNGAAAADNAEVYLSGGVTTAGIINFGLATDTAGGQGYLIITNASLYVGSGGINQPNTTGYTSTISLLGGTLGAAAGWSSSLPMQLSGTSFTIQAADASNAAHNIALNGALSGAGALVKTGGGTLALGGADSYTGATTVSNGTLVVNGSTAGAGVDVLTNATLGGAGTIGDPAVTIEDGGHTLPGGALGNSGGATNTISGNLAYMAGAEADFNLGTVYNSGNDQIAVNGALSGNNVNVGVNFTGGAGNNLDKTGYTLFQVNGANAASFNTAPVWIGTPPANSNLFSVVSIGNNVVLSGSPIRIASATATPNPAGHGQVVSFAVNVTAGSYTINPGTGIVLNASPIGGSSALYLVQSNGTSIYTNSFTIPASPAFGSYALSYTVTDSNGDTISPSITLNIGGAPEVWNGNASPDNTWANALNWANGYAPETGDLVFFAGNNQLTPDMNGGYSISALTFAGGAGGFNITNDGASALTLTGGVTNNSADTESVGVPVVLNGRPAFNTAAGSIVVSNVVTDDGNGLLKTGPGTLYLTGANTYTGPTTVGGGALYISTAIQGNGVAYENFIVNDGATLGVINTGVRGMIENLTLGNNAGPTTLVFTNITAGNVIVSGGGAASVMEVYGDSGGILTLNGNCTVRVADTNGLAAGNEYGLFYTLNPTNKNGAAFQFSPPPGVAGYVTNDAANDVIGLVVTSMTAPVAAFSGTPTNGLAPLQVVFTNSSTGSYTNSVWNFGDGHSATNSTGANVTNTYAATGGYTVSLTVSGAGGVSSLTNTAYIVATAPAPVAGFTGTPTTGFAPLQVAFTNSSTGSYTNSVWSFGDGHSATNSTGANVTNTYAATGGYTVSLTVGGAGGSSTDTRTAYVAVKPAPALGRPALSGGNFMFSGTNGPAGVQYRILTATNIAAALTNWTPVLTNVFGSDGSYGYTNTAPTNNASFFILKSP